MSRAVVDEICKTMPGAVASDPSTELDSWKVGGKMFATFGTKLDGFSVKTDSIETATMLIDAGAARRAKYFHRSWVTVSFDADPAELAHRIGVSYDLIRASLPKKVRDGLDQG